jgi:hypothetical protein
MRSIPSVNRSATGVTAVASELQCCGLSLPADYFSASQSNQKLGPRRSNWLATPLYVAAAITLLEAETPDLIESVVRGDISLLKAAEAVRKRVRLVRAYRDADRNDRRALGKVIGIDRLFDEAIMPSL